MIKIENVEVLGWEAAIRGMRNPMNSWDKSDSGVSCTMDMINDCLNDEYINCDDCHGFKIGPKDHDLMNLASGGPVHAKYRRMIVVYADITAPLYWWKEFDTYKVGTVANSCSTMHKIHEKEFTLEEFSCEHLRLDEMEHMKETISLLNCNRELYLDGKGKGDWWQMIQLLPSSYNQRRTILLVYIQ